MNQDSLPVSIVFLFHHKATVTEIFCYPDFVLPDLPLLPITIFQFPLKPTQSKERQLNQQKRSQS